METHGNVTWKENEFLTLQSKWLDFFYLYVKIHKKKVCFSPRASNQSKQSITRNMDYRL